MITLKQTKEKIEADPKWWCIHLMNFVDDFRWYKDARAVSEPFEFSHENTDALLASTAEALCDELGLTPPDWIAAVPACREPFFVSGFERLKAISIVESPLRFRLRKIF